MLCAPLELVGYSRHSDAWNKSPCFSTVLIGSIVPLLAFIYLCWSQYLFSCQFCYSYCRIRRKGHCIREQNHQRSTSLRVIFQTVSKHPSPFTDENRFILFTKSMRICLCHRISFGYKSLAHWHCRGGRFTLSHFMSAWKSDCVRCVSAVPVFRVCFPCSLELPLEKIGGWCKLVQYRETIVLEHKRSQVFWTRGYAVLSQ